MLYRSIPIRLADTTAKAAVVALLLALKCHFVNVFLLFVISFLARSRSSVCVCFTVSSPYSIVIVLSQFALASYTHTHTYVVRVSGTINHTHT